MPAPKGNNYNKKWKTKEERQEAFQAVYDHLASGFSKGSFPLADWDTVEAYMVEFPEDFPPEKVSEAMRCQKFMWEELGMNGAKGKVDGFNATAWIFNMKNRFPTDWRDKREVDMAHDLSDPMKELLDFVNDNGKRLGDG